uniref:fumarylacetoacetate hydrolase family protein n=1 Tax=uncultured Sphingomonas sp. TaxID=158754 RepID=UPI0035CA3ED8
MPALSPAFALGRFRDISGTVFTAVVSDGRALPLASLMPEYGRDPMLADLLPDWPARFDRLKAAVIAADGLSGALPLGSLTALVPIARPPQVFCAGANYGRHVVDMVIALGVSPDTDGMDTEQRRAFGLDYVRRQKVQSNPFVFMLPATAVVGPQDDIPIPAGVQKMDWELELGVVIGREAHRISREHAMDVVAGYVVVNDVTARDMVKRTDAGAIGPDWLAGKGGPGYLPVGPLFVPAEFVADPQNMPMRLWVNDELMQDDTTADMTFGIARLIEHVSGHARMLPGDLLCTGSPTGNGITRGVFLKPGDTVEAEIEGLGRQVNRCIAAGH